MARLDKTEGWVIKGRTIGTLVPPFYTLSNLNNVIKNQSKNTREPICFKTNILLKNPLFMIFDFLIMTGWFMTFRNISLVKLDTSKASAL